MTGRRARSGPVRAALALALSTLVVCSPPGPALAREERVAAIGNRELQIAIPDGDCFFDADRPAERGLIEQLTAASGGAFVVLLAFTDCPSLQAWRQGKPAALPRLGYFMIAEAHLEPVFAFDQPALTEAISAALKERGAIDYRANVAHLARDLEAAWKSLARDGRQELGIIHRDRYGPVLATVLAVADSGGKTAPRVMLHQSLMLNGKVVSVVAARDYASVESIFDAYGDLSAAVEATASRN